MWLPNPALESVKHGDIPLCVDLDGTLINTDSLYEGLISLLKQNFWYLFLLPLWLLRGKADFKAQIARRVHLDVEFLPYNTALIEFIKSQRPLRHLVLCTAADARFAQAVSDHLGLFDELIATTKDVNLSAANKAKALCDRFGVGAYDYAGNDVADIAVFARARRSLIVNPTRGLRRHLPSIDNIEQRFSTPKRNHCSIGIKSIRLHQWVKNLLVFVPILAIPEAIDIGAVVTLILAFFSYSLIASSVYLVNDLLDLAADRRHPRKKNRPFAAGTLAISNGLIMASLLLLVGFSTALLISPLFFMLLLLYYTGTNLYTFWLKRVPLLDTLVLAGLYTSRILAGAAAITVEPSFWLLAFSMFFFLSLALAKRHSELVEMVSLGGAAGLDSSIPGRGYRHEDLATLMAQGSASGYSAVLVFAFYINSEAARQHYNHPEVIWLICPLLLYWINKLWLNSQRREINDDPVIWAMTNRVSRGIAVLCALLLLLARWLP